MEKNKILRYNLYCKKKSKTFQANFQNFKKFTKNLTPPSFLKQPTANFRHLKIKNYMSKICSRLFFYNICFLQVVLKIKNYNNL